MKTKFKKSKGLLLAIVAILFGTLLVQAQPESPKGPPPIPNEKQIQKMVSDLSAELSLDETQQQKVSEMFVAHFNEMKEVQDKYKDSHEAERKEMDGIKTEFEKEMKTVLTQEQQKQFDAFMKNKRPQGGAKGQRPQKP